jgi:hypothetical protein
MGRKRKYPRIYKSKAAFHLGQVVCVRGLIMPLGCAKIVTREGHDLWRIEIEIDGKLDTALRSTGELRQLTRRECGPR